MSEDVFPPGGAGGFAAGSLPAGYVDTVSDPPAPGRERRLAGRGAPGIAKLAGSVSGRSANRRNADARGGQELNGRE